MTQPSSLSDKLIALLQQRLSNEDVHVIADDYGERSRHDEQKYSRQKRSLYERLVDKAEDADSVRLLVLHAMYHKDVTGLLHLLFEYRPDLQQAVDTLGFERSSLIRAYLVSLVQEMNTIKARDATAPGLLYRVREPETSWLEVSLTAFQHVHSRVILHGATATERSATLHRLIKSLAAEWQGARASAPFPVFADMRHWFNPKMNLIEFLQAQISWLGVPQLAEQLPSFLQDGRVVLLLDGVDELPYRKSGLGISLYDDPRARSLVTWSQEQAWSNVQWMLSCQRRDFVFRQHWHTLYVLDAVAKDEPVVEDAFIHPLKADIEQALKQEIVAGHMSADEANELLDRLGYLALNITYPESRRKQTELSRENTVEKGLVAAWLFHLRALPSNKQAEYHEPEASPEEQLQATRILQLAQATGLLISNSEGVRFASGYIQHYFIVSYCLTQSLDDPSFLTRVSNYEFRAIWPLWQEFDPTLTDKLLTLLQNTESTTFRTCAAYALSWCNDNRAVQPLIVALKDEDTNVRGCAAFALGNLGDRRAVDALLAAYGDPHPLARNSILSALAEVATEDERYIDLLLKSLEDATMREFVVPLMKGIRNERLIEPLVALLADTGTKYSATKALTAFGKAAVPDLMVALLDGNVGSQYRETTESSSWYSRGEVSYNAAEVLGEIGDIRPLPQLMWLTEHDEEVGEAEHGNKVRHVATKAIEKIQEQHQQAAPLVAALQNKDTATRIGAAFALGMFRDQRAYELLVESLRDKDKRIRWGAAGLLGGLGNACAIVPLLTAMGDDEYQVSANAEEALHKFGEMALSPLIAALSHENSTVRGRTAELLGWLRNKQAVEPLISVLADENSGVCRQAATALGMLRDKRALEPLVALASDPDPDVRTWIPATIYNLDHDRAIDVLIEALQDKSDDIRLSAMRDLCKMGNSHAVEPLIAALRDDYHLVREYAGYALREYGDERAVEPLIQSLQDEFLLANQAAVGALGAIGDSRAIEPLIQKLQHEDQKYCSTVANALVGFGVQVTPFILAALKDEGSDTPATSFDSYLDSYRDEDQIMLAHLHYYAADILGKVGDTRAIPVLLWMSEKDKNTIHYGRQRVADAASEAVKSIIQRHQDAIRLVAALNNQDTTARIGAAFALSLLNNERAREVLVSATTDSDRRIRWGAVRLLGEMGGVEAVHTLISTFEDEDEAVLHSVVEALTTIGLPATETLLTACREENSASYHLPISTWIAYTLGQIGKTTPDFLLAALKDQDSHIRYWAARASGWAERPEAIEPLRGTFQDDEAAVRLSAASALVQLGDTQAWEYVVAGLKDADTEIRLIAIENLLPIARAEATEPLIAALEDENQDVRSMAVLALGEMGDSRALPALGRLAGIHDFTWHPVEALVMRRESSGRRITIKLEEQDMLEPASDEVVNPSEAAGEMSKDPEQMTWWWPKVAESEEGLEALSPTNWGEQVPWQPPQPESEGLKKPVREAQEDLQPIAEDDFDNFINWGQSPIEELQSYEEPVEGNTEEQEDDELRELAKRAIKQIKSRSMQL